MILEAFFVLHAGGPGSGCKGENCGRPRKYSVDSAEGVARANGFEPRVLTKKGVAVRRGEWGRRTQNVTYLPGQFEDREGRQIILEDSGWKFYDEYGVKRSGTELDELENVLRSLSAGGPGSGCRGDNCGRPSTGRQDRSARAKSTHSPVTMEKRRHGAASQDHLAKLVQGVVTEDHAPFDVIVQKTAIEVKTLVDQKNDKLTMHPDSLKRKLKDAKRFQRVFTVVYDKRPGSSGIYVRKGVGSFRVHKMQRVTGDQLRKILMRG